MIKFSQPSVRTNHVLKRIAGWVALPSALFCALFAACSPTVSVSNVKLSAPWGLALAGSAHDRVFVSNYGEGTVHVMNVQADLQALNFVPSPAQFFPLRIPAGPAPTDLGATPNGRYVAVLDATTAMVRLIDADSLLMVRDDTGAVLELPLGGALTRAASLVASPVACDAPCLGRLFVALEGPGQVIEVEVQETAADANGVTSATLSMRAVFDVGGAPQHLAVHPQGHTVYASDGVASELIQLRVVDGVAGAADSSATRGTVARYEVGDVGGAVAVSQSGTQVLVARPQFKDVLIFSVSDAAALSVLNADSANAPTPRCVLSCTDTPGAAGVCTDGSPADESVCTNATGYGATLTPYQAVYVGLVPAVMATLAANTALGTDGLTVACIPTGSTTVQTRTYTAFAAVAGFDGAIHFIGLTTDGDAARTPEVVSTGWCQPTVLESLTEAAVPAARLDVPLADFLDACPATASPLARLTCVQGLAGADVTPGVLAMAQQVKAAHWQFAWEGVVVSRGDAVAELQADGVTVLDRGVDLRGRLLEVNDIFDVVTNPVDGSACAAAGRCGLERRIVSIAYDEPSNTTTLVLDRALDAACFAGPSVTLQYLVRAGDSFLTTSPAGTGVERLRPGAFSGPGFAVGRYERAAFRLRSLDVHAELNACDRYDAATGLAKAPMPAALSRTGVIGFGLTDYFAPVSSGQAVDATGAVTGTVGRLPTNAIVVPRAGTTEPMVVISYTGADALLAFVPHNPARAQESARYRVLR